MTIEKLDKEVFGLACSAIRFEWGIPSSPFSREVVGDKPNRLMGIKNHFRDIARILEFAAPDRPG